MPPPQRRYRHLVMTPACVFLTGRAGSGKRTVANLVAEELRRREQAVALLGADAVGRHLTEGPDALAWCCRLLVENGVTVVVAIEVAERDDRELLRSSIPRFAEVYLDAPADVCATRAGRADPTFEEPWAPDLRVPTHGRDPSASAAQVISFLEERGVAARTPGHPSDR